MTYREMGLNDAEFQLILETLGREPSITEIGMYAVMWSEHCGYKYSRPVLRLFKKYREAMDTGAVENAGVVDIGDGYGVVMKMESHNHPSAVEPFQGAATGVGGILRDIFTMGARPIGSLNSLRFGPLTDTRSRYLFERVVEGIAHYGNCVGVPTIGGEIVFDPCYLGNPLVNAMAVGIVPLDAIASAAAKGVGNVVIYVGSSTGRDGIHGATFASVELGPDSESRRPNVQIGDPFQEKLLIEATLEALESGWVVGIQDMGAAGLTCSTSETASKAGNGMEIEVRLVPAREPGMSPYELMLSESQERMLAIVERANAEKVLAIFRKWGLSAAIIGEVTDTGRVVVKDDGVVVADIPARSLTDECPTYALDAAEPAYLAQVRADTFDLTPHSSDLGANLLALISSPTIASKRWVYQQYDHMVQTQTTVFPGDADAAVLRVRGTSKAIALTTDCNGRYCYLDPHLGALHSVAEAARNLSCSGARPAAVTDCLNFPNPEKPDNFWVFRKCVEGLAEACEAFDTPVISGNVSFYNETPDHAIFPTPTIGMIGVIDDPNRRMTMAFKSAGDEIHAIGLGPAQLAGSELSYLLSGKAHGAPPKLDLAQEIAAQKLVRDLIARGMVKSAHDVSEGGLATALAECCIKGEIGAKIDFTEEGADPMTALFGERSATIVITVAAGATFASAGVEARKIGLVEGDRLTIRSGVETLDLPISKLTSAYENAIPELLHAAAK
jgi:phosphoribosylformylglycinamidine synthase